MTNLNKGFEAFKRMIYDKYGDNAAKMLIYTGVLGWFLSSAAQVVAIMANKEVPREAKFYMIPQEIGDGAVNILSFFAITSVIKKLGSKAVSTGILTTKTIRNFLRSKNFYNKKNIGYRKFDIGELFTNKDITNGSKEYKDYKDFKAGVEVAAMTIGSIISCNIATPILRNRIAEDRQKKSMEKHDINKSKTIQHPKGISISEFQRIASYNPHSGSLRI